MQTTIATAPLPKPRSSSCSYCGTIHANDESLRLHCQNNHLEKLFKEWFQCLDCKDFFPTLKRLRMHASKAHGLSTEFPCSLCPTVLKTCPLFHRHLLRTHPDWVIANWYKCRQCCLYFPMTAYLKAHEKRCKKIRKIQREVHRGRLVCSYCSKICDDVKRFHLHVNGRHLDKIRRKWIRCSKCSYYFKDIVHYELHQCTEDLQKRMTCYHCSPEVVHETKELLYTHLSENHVDVVRGSGWKKCVWCHVYVPSSHHLRRHELKFHFEAASRTSSTSAASFHPCDFCSEFCPNSANFIKHNNKRHKETIIEVRWVYCEGCDTYFPDKFMASKHACLKKEEAD